MSFDLFFCCKEAKALDFERVADWSERYPYFSRTAKGQLFYENRDTGVYFSLDGSREDATDPEDSPIPAGFADVGLAFNLNFNRPSYFAYEAMPIVEDLAKEFSLLIVDPQGDSPLPQECNATRLIREWSASNESAIRYLSEQADFNGTFLYMPQADSLNFWRYMSGKSELQSKLGDDVFMPRLVLVQRVGSTRVQTALVWTPGIPMVVPKHDWAAIVRERKRGRLGRAKKETGYISSSTLMRSVGAHLEDFDRVTGLRILRAAKAAQVGRVLESVPLEHKKAEFKGVAPDGFVDVELPVTRPAQ